MILDSCFYHIDIKYNYIKNSLDGSIIQGIPTLGFDVDENKHYISNKKSGICKISSSEGQFKGFHIEKLEDT